MVSPLYPVALVIPFFPLYNLLWYMTTDPFRKGMGKIITVNSYSDIVQSFLKLALLPYSSPMAPGSKNWLRSGN